MCGFKVQTTMDECSLFGQYHQIQGYDFLDMSVIRLCEVLLPENWRSVHNCICPRMLLMFRKVLRVYIKIEASNFPLFSFFFSTKKNEALHTRPAGKKYAQVTGC